ncbi:hypothetical protein NMY22_g12931 [Coprinellus aureogranulatus]|nr:hypothetical protein NMY22_g12931 [Coprinellus aureogranulatus]
MDLTDAAVEAVLRTPIRRIIQGAKAGSTDSILLLELRVDEAYSNHAVAILDAIMPFFEDPPEDPQLFQVHAKAAYASMGVLSKIFEWLKRYPAPSPAQFASLSRITAASHKFVDWSHRILQRAIEEPDDPEHLVPWSIIGRFFYTLFATPTDVLQDLAKYPPMLSLAVTICQILHRGLPIIYPSVRRGGPHYDRPDFASAILFFVAGTNALGVTETIHGGAICSPETFVERIVLRMQYFSKVNSIPHLSHRPENASEKLNIHYLIGATHWLMEQDSRMRDLFMEYRAPEVYLTTVSAESAKLRDFVDCADRAEELIMLAVIPYLWWERVESKGILARAKSLTEGGILKLIGNVLLYTHKNDAKAEGEDDPIALIQNRLHFNVGYLIRSVTPYLLYPEIIRSGMGEIEEHILSRLDELPPKSLYKKIFTEAYRSLRSIEQLVPRDRQEGLCDSLLHHARHMTSSRTKRADPEKREDWSAFHRLECKHWRSKYSERKPSKRWYSYSHRRYHTNIMRYAFESTEVGIRLLGPTGTIGEYWTYYSPVEVARRLDFMGTHNTLGTIFHTDSLDSWVRERAPLVPDILHPRLDAFIGRFTSSVQLSHYTPGSFRLLQHNFFFGDENVTLLVLLKQVSPLPGPCASTEDTVRMARNFTDRDSDTKSHYEFIGSFAFSGPSRGRDTLGESELDLGVDPTEVDLSGATPTTATGTEDEREEDHKGCIRRYRG